MRRRRSGRGVLPAGVGGQHNCAQQQGPGFLHRVSLKVPPRLPGSSNRGGGSSVDDQALGRGGTPVTLEAMLRIESLQSLRKTDRRKTVSRRVARPRSAVIAGLSAHLRPPLITTSWGRKGRRLGRGQEGRPPSGRQGEGLYPKGRLLRFIAREAAEPKGRRVTGIANGKGLQSKGKTIRGHG